MDNTVNQTPPLLNEIKLNVKDVQMALKLFEGINNDCDLTVKDDSFRISVVSSCNSMMGQYTAPCGNSTDCDGMLEVKDFQTALKRCKKDTTITMTNEQLLVKHEKGFVALRLKDRPAGSFKALPELQFQSTFEADCSEIATALTPLISMSGGDSESIVFSIEKNGQIVKKKEEIATELRLKYIGLKGQSEQIIDGYGAGQAKAMFGVSYLKQLFSVVATARVQMSNDYPMQVSYLNDNDLDLKVILAPRVLND